MSDKDSVHLRNRFFFIYATNTRTDNTVNMETWMRVQDTILLYILETIGASM
jgi:hypothetical protein